MLWSRLKSLRRSALFCGLVVLSGCGFRPLYSQPGATGGAGRFNVQSDLAGIEIMPIKDRVGQQLRNLLLTGLNPTGEPAKADYDLLVTISESVQQLGIKKSSFATRANLHITATYSLTRTASSVTGDTANATATSALSSGHVLATSSYDISTYEFTTLTARKDARRRAVREIADDLQTRLAVFFVQYRKLK